MNDQEIVRPETGEIVKAEASAMVALPLGVKAAITQWQEYQALTRELLDDSDFQHIGARKFKKKSAWRKYARAFNITDEVTFEHIERSPDGFPLWARVRVKATASNGRTAEADHECHVTERCCDGDCNKRHAHCLEGCTGRVHFSHPGDLPATALTRAKNRAISDLIGAGEVSAEEMEGQKEQRDSFSQPSGSGICPKHKVAYVHTDKQKAGGYPPSHKDGAGWCVKQTPAPGDEDDEDDAPAQVQPEPASALPETAKAIAVRALTTLLGSKPQEWAAWVRATFPDTLGLRKSPDYTEAEWGVITTAVRAALAGANDLGSK